MILNSIVPKDVGIDYFSILEIEIWPPCPSDHKTADGNGLRVRLTQPMNNLYCIGCHCRLPEGAILEGVFHRAGPRKPLRGRDLKEVKSQKIAEQLKWNKEHPKEFFEWANARLAYRMAKEDAKLVNGLLTRLQVEEKIESKELKVRTYHGVYPNKIYEKKYPTTNRVAFSSGREKVINLIEKYMPTDRYNE